MIKFFFKEFQLFKWKFWISILLGLHVTYCHNLNIQFGNIIQESAFFLHFINYYLLHFIQNSKTIDCIYLCIHSFCMVSSCKVCCIFKDWFNNFPSNVPVSIPFALENFWAWMSWLANCLTVFCWSATRLNWSQLPYTHNQSYLTAFSLLIGDFYAWTDAWLVMYTKDINGTGDIKCTRNIDHMLIKSYTRWPHKE